MSRKIIGREKRYVEVDVIRDGQKLKFEEWARFEPQEEDA